MLVGSKYGYVCVCGRGGGASRRCRCLCGLLGVCVGGGVCAPRFQENCIQDGSLWQLSSRMGARVPEGGACVCVCVSGCVGA